jgi:hypothetical protein
MNQLATDYLTPSGSFLLGVASAFAISGGFFQVNGSSDSNSADARALRQDFAMIGQDITQGREKFDRENSKCLAA